MPDSHANGQSDWRDTVVSIVPNAWETKTTNISLGVALEKIHKGRWAKPVARIREKYAEVLGQAEKAGNPDPHAVAKDAIVALKKTSPQLLSAVASRFARATDSILTRAIFVRISTKFHLRIV